MGWTDKVALTLQKNRKNGGNDRIKLEASTLLAASYTPRLSGAHVSVPMATREATDVSRVQHGGRLTAIDQPGHEAVIYPHTLHRFLFSTKTLFF